MIYSSLSVNVRDSLIILKSICTELSNANSAFLYTWKIKNEESNRTPRNQSDFFDVGTTMYAVLYFSIIKYLSFVDEYQLHFLKAGQTDEERVKILKIDSNSKQKEYFKFIDEIFPELKIARNKILAHGYREGKHNGYKRLKSREIDDLFKKMTSHSSPTNYGALCSVPYRIIEEIEKEFGKINEDVLSDLEDSGF